MDEFEFVFMLEQWNDILKRFCQTSKSLQDPKVSLSTCSKLYISLTEYLTEVRESFHDYELKAQTKLPGVAYRAASKPSQRKKTRDDDR